MSNDRLFNIDEVYSILCWALKNLEYEYEHTRLGLIEYPVLKAKKWEQKKAELLNSKNLVCETKSQEIIDDVGEWDHKKAKAILKNRENNAKNI